MALDIGLGQGSDVDRRDLLKLDALRQQLALDDLDRALPYQGSNEAGMLVSGASWIDIAISVLDRAIIQLMLLFVCSC